MRRKAFTLTEVLVVISGTAMLMGMLAPALNVTRQRAKAVACGSNLRQLMYAMVIYEQENGTFPSGFDDLTSIKPPGGYPGSGTRDLQGWWWFHLLTDTTVADFNESTIFWCPSRNVSDPYILCGNYGVNRAICMDQPNPDTGKLDGEFVGRPLGLNRIRRPAETLLIADSGYSLISWRAATDAAPTCRFEVRKREGAFYVPGMEINQGRFLDGTISPGFERDAMDGRHLDKTVNVGFADSHLARVKAEDLFVEEVDNDVYNNLSPLWLPK